MTDWLKELSDCLTVWLIDWLTDWLTEWLTDWLTDWKNCMTVGLTDCLTDWKNCRTVGLTDWLTGWLTVSHEISLAMSILNYTRTHTVAKLSLVGMQANLLKCKINLLSCQPPTLTYLPPSGNIPLDSFSIYWWLSQSFLLWTALPHNPLLYLLRTAYGCTQIDLTGHKWWWWQQRRRRW